MNIGRRCAPQQINFPKKTYIRNGRMEHTHTHTITRTRIGKMKHRTIQYIVERHGNTLLPQYLGMYRLTVDGVQYYFVVMRNVFSSHLSIHR